jgi:hypothetical protein
MDICLKINDMKLNLKEEIYACIYTMLVAILKESVA